MLGEVWTASLQGVEGVPVRVEAQVSVGIPGLFLVGLPRGAAREGRDRVQAALRSIPDLSDALRVTLNLAPADLVKEGSALDLAMAVAVLVGAGKIPRPLPGNVAFLGELGLDARLHPVPGLLPLALGCLRAGFGTVVVPREGAAEVSPLAPHLEVVPVRNLVEALRWAAGGGHPPAGEPPAHMSRALPGGHAPDETSPPEEAEDLFGMIRGQQLGKRALQVAAAGGHGLLLVGPPGAGKTLLARALPGLLPPLDPDASLEVSSIHSAAGLLTSGRMLRRPPFRAPHHGASRGALVGGGTPLRPGEVTLAHRGVLFLDEIPHWDRAALESLREPLEAGVVDIIRTGRRARFPADFLLVGAMNPCPCGLHGDPEGRCTCAPQEVLRYQGRLSAPLLDRIDLRLRVLPPLPETLLRPPAEGEGEGEGARARAQVARAREGAQAGVALAPGQGGRGSRPRCTPRALREAERLAEGFRLSPRGVVRVLGVARTVALLEGAEEVDTPHLLEAFQYRGTFPTKAAE